MDYGNTAPRDAEMSPEPVKLTDLSPGDVVQLDSHFTCAKGLVIIQKDPYGELYFPCQDGKHYLIGQLNDDGYLVGITRPTAQIIPITQSERTPMSDFNPEDANAVSRFFQSIADKVVLASTLPKEVQELREELEKLKADVAAYRDHIARADEEITNLRRERQQLQDENAGLQSDLNAERQAKTVAETRWNQSCTERDRWHNDFIAASTDLETVKKERDEAQMKIMELEETVKYLQHQCDKAEESHRSVADRLNSIRMALAA